MYVEPLYIAAEKGRLPELKRVIVGFGDRIAMEETLEGALARVFGGPVPQAGAEVAPSPCRWGPRARRNPCWMPRPLPSHEPAKSFVASASCCSDCGKRAGVSVQCVAMAPGRALGLTKRVFASAPTRQQRPRKKSGSAHPPPLHLALQRATAQSRMCAKAHTDFVF